LLVISVANGIIVPCPQTWKRIRLFQLTVITYIQIPAAVLPFLRCLQPAPSIHPFPSAFRLLVNRGGQWTRRHACSLTAHGRGTPPAHPSQPAPGIPARKATALLRLCSSGSPQPEKSTALSRERRRSPPFPSRFHDRERRSQQLKPKPCEAAQVACWSDGREGRLPPECVRGCALSPWRSTRRRLGRYENAIPSSCCRRYLI
jgi:hypothetical protein